MAYLNKIYACKLKSVDRNTTFELSIFIFMLTTQQLFSLDLTIT